jgi:hypothetical protein
MQPYLVPYIMLMLAFKAIVPLNRQPAKQVLENKAPSYTIAYFYLALRTKR